MGSGSNNNNNNADNNPAASKNSDGSPTDEDSRPSTPLADEKSEPFCLEANAIAYWSLLVMCVFRIL